jgi:hypothetical protein
MAERMHAQIPSLPLDHTPLLADSWGNHSGRDTRGALLTLFTEERGGK